jgi:hypothetical protein
VVRSVPGPGNVDNPTIEPCYHSKGKSMSHIPLLVLSTDVKRGREEDSTPEPVPAPMDQLSSVPKRIFLMTQDGKFTLCDLVIVANNMHRMFGLKFDFSGPGEGSIEVQKRSGSPFADLLPKTVTNVEMRFSGTLPSIDGLRLARAISEALVLGQYTVDANATCKDAVTKILNMRTRRFINDSDVNITNALELPLPLNLSVSQPRNTWPFWLYAVFESLVMLRVALNR